jgi:hypothetical protein
MGLSFSVPPGKAVPSSLQNMYKELADDCGCTIPRHGDLRKVPAPPHAGHKPGLSARCYLSHAGCPSRMLVPRSVGYVAGHMMAQGSEGL